MRTWIKTVAALTAGFGIAVEAHAQAQGRPLSEAEMAIIRSAVEQKLTDPASATYRWQPGVQKDGSGQYCAEINAKNRYGGYVGFSIFIVRVTWANGSIVAADRAGIPDPSMPAEKRVTHTICKTWGYDIGA